MIIKWRRSSINSASKGGIVPELCDEPSLSRTCALVYLPFSEVLTNEALSLHEVCTWGWYGCCWQSFNWGPGARHGHEIWNADDTVQHILPHDHRNVAGPSTQQLDMQGDWSLFMFIATANLLYTRNTYLIDYSSSIPIRPPMGKTVIPSFKTQQFANPAQGLNECEIVPRYCKERLQDSWTNKLLVTIR